jgi:hypothetical protein
VQIVAKHKQHYFEEDPIGESWTCSHFILPHDIHNAMDLYVSLEYKHHRDIATRVKLWVYANPKIIFSFQQEPLNSKSFGFKLIFDIQTLYQKKLIVDLGHEKVVACDTTFETNDTKVLLSIYLQWFIFSRSTWFS